MHRALVSPHGKPRSGMLDGVERGARAFAACFLAPGDGVRAAVGSGDPTTEDAIHAVGSRFGVGRTVAINRLQHVFALSDDQRMAMATRPEKPYEGDFEGDAVDEPLGYRGGALLRLVHDALAHGKLSRTRAHRLLGLGVDEELPFPDLDPAVRAPLVSASERMRRRVDAILAADAERMELLGSSAERVGDKWRVSVVAGGVGAREVVNVGHVLLSSSGELLEDHIVLPRAGSGEPSAHS